MTVATRFLPHAPNFTAVGALALFAGAKFSKKWAWLVPLFAMFASDAVIGFYDWKLMTVVYASFLAFAGMGQALQHPYILQFIRMLFVRRYWMQVAFGSLAGSTLFFLATNFAVWLFSDWYPKTLGGLMLSYAFGLPFFRNMLLGDLVYTGMFFGVYALSPVFARCFRKRSRMGIAHANALQYTVNK